MNYVTINHENRKYNIGFSWLKFNITMKIRINILEFHGYYLSYI